MFFALFCYFLFLKFNICCFLSIFWVRVFAVSQFFFALTSHMIYLYYLEEAVLLAGFYFLVFDDFKCKTLLRL